MHIGMWEISAWSGNIISFGDYSVKAFVESCPNDQVKTSVFIA